MEYLEFLGIIWITEVLGLWCYFSLHCSIISYTSSLCSDQKRLLLFSNSNFLIVRVDIVSRDFRFHIFQRPIDVCNIFVCLNNDSFSIICMSRSLMIDFILSSLFTLFYFSFLFPFNFLFLEQLGLGFISHAVTSVTSWWHSHKTDHRTWENEVEGSGIK